MKAIAYNIFPEEKEWLAIANRRKHAITIASKNLSENTLNYALGMDAILIFNGACVSKTMVSILKTLGVKYIVIASLEIGPVDLSAASLAGMKVTNIPYVDADAKFRMEKLIKNLDQLDKGQSVGSACCCKNKSVKLEMMAT